MSALEQLTQIEEMRAEGPAAVQVSSAADFLVSVLSAGPMTKEELRERAIGGGYFDADSAGRGVHAILLNLARGHRIRECEGGRYMLPPNASGTV